MKIKLFACLFLLINLSCCLDSYANELTADTAKHHKPIKRAAFPPPTTPEQFHKWYKSWFDNCRFTNTYSLARRLKKFPFSKAAKVLAVSYRSLSGPETPAVQDSLEKGLLSAEEKN